MRKVLSLIHAWLVLDFFGDARRHGGGGSSLTTTILGQAFLALVFAALLYPETPRVPFAAANLCLSTLLVAVGLLGNEDRWNRRRADEALVRSSPTGRGTLVIARGGHAAFYVVLLTTGMALPPAVLLAFLTGDWTQIPAYVVLACLVSGLAAGTLGVVTRALVRLLGTDRAALAGASLKAMLLGGGLVAFGTGLTRLKGTADELPLGRFCVELLPPYQAARVLADPGTDAWRFGALLATGVVLFLMAIAIGDERSSRASVSRIDPLRRLVRAIARSGPTLAIAEFTAISMWRSASFRSRVLPLLGLPAGMVFLSLQDDESKSRGYVFSCLLLQLPAIYLPFLIAFLPRADQPDTGWIFQIAPRLSREQIQDATWRALVSHVLVPVHVLAFVLLMSVTPRIDTVAASLFALGVAVLASRAMVRSLSFVPFSRADDADVTVDLGGSFAAALLLGGTAAGFGGALPAWARWIAVLLVSAGAVALLRTRPAAANDVAAAGRPEGRVRTEPTGNPADPTPSDAARTGSLRGELRAIGVLYVAVSVVPALIGTMFAA